MDYSDYKTKTSLILPFKGTWGVSNGGRDPEKNNHYGIRAQHYAYDFIQPHRDEGKLLEDYQAFGAQVISPGNGIVSEVVHDRPDMPIGERDTEVISGNLVVIDHENGEWSFLCHFKKDSIVVKGGDRVEQGQTLGFCGNSGNTSQPHIHYHLQNNAHIDEADSLPAQFAKIIVNDETRELFEPELNQEVSNP